MYEDFTSTGVDGLLKACASDGFKRGEQAGLAHQAEAVRELRAALMGLEWHDSDELGQWYCPECGNGRDKGHTASCELAAVLARYPEEPSRE